MLDTRRDIPGKHWGDYQFTDHDYDGLSADPTVDVRVLPALTSIVRAADLGGYQGLTASNRASFAELMSKTKFVSSTKTDPIQGSAVPTTDGSISRWFPDAVAAGYAVLVDLWDAGSQRATLTMTRQPAVAVKMTSPGARWAVAAAPDGMVDPGLSKGPVPTLTLQAPSRTTVAVPTYSPATPQLPGTDRLPTLQLPSPTTVQVPIMTRTPAPSPTRQVTVDAVSALIRPSSLIDGVVAKTVVGPAESTRQLFPTIASTQPQTIVSSTPMYPPIMKPTPPSDYTPTPLGPMPGRTVSPLIDQPVDISSLIRSGDLPSTIKPMPGGTYTPDGSGPSIYTPDGTLPDGILNTMPTTQTQQQGGQLVTTGEEGALVPAESSKTLYYVAGGIAAVGIGYYLWSKSQKSHRPNCSSRRRLRTR